MFWKMAVYVREACAIGIETAMTKDPSRWLVIPACVMAGLIGWYVYSMFEFYHGWIRLDPRCVTDGDFRYPIHVIDGLYTPEAAALLKDVIASMFSEEAVLVDDDGVVYIRPPLYYGYHEELDRFAQLVVRPEDRMYLYQRPGISCDEMQQLVRSEIDETKWEVDRYAFSFYVLLTRPDWATLDRWDELYMKRRRTD
jgi:hypothetical protein